ncbi:MAG TPA: sigma-70 family RNA polymerase sigma factor [Terriglobia bacterium]|nr:sigma-70 family RNA polymerase sigma factor [Terriglobia bacterium]
MIPPEYKDFGDPELIGRCLQGDGAAWEALILRYRRLIYSVPSGFRFAPDDSADVFQSVCLTLIEHLHELKDETRLASWLITTATRQCLRLRSRRYREPHFEEGTEAEERPAGDASVEEVRLLAERSHAIREGVRRLPDRCRTLIELLFFSTRDYSYEDIGKTLQMPVASIGPTRARCLAKLQALLRPRGIR